MNRTKKLAVIGAGNVGLTLAVLAQQSGRYEVCIGARDIGKAQSKLAGAGESLPVLTPAAAASCDIVLLTVPDADIQSLCEALAGQFCPDAVVAHCSGALSSDVLRAAPCPVASLHPLQTFPDVQASLRRVATSRCFYEGDSAALPVIAGLARNVGMQPIAIQKSAKTLYHACAVMACNHFTALMDASLQMAGAAGIERQDMWQSLAPLVAATLENISSVGVESALTGPVVRGDGDTVRQHLQCLAINPAVAELEALYRELGKQTVEVARRSGRTTDEKLRDVEAVLSENSAPG